MLKTTLKLSIVGAASLFTHTLMAAGIPGLLEETVVVGEQENAGLMGEALSASVGTVTQQQLEHRPILRPAELLETVPGMIVTQHSGDGKANQYFMRGFNLDHGTDFANYVEGMPVNMVTHGHGQGYTDLNFLIPELVSHINYRKGPYYAEEGDFSSAGSIRTHYVNRLDKHRASIKLGDNNYRRTLLIGGVDLGGNHLVYGVEQVVNDGPWVVAEDFEKKNLTVKYIHGDDEQGFSVSGMYYDAEWLATDQVPQRLVDSGQLDRYGSLDDTTGGDSSRYSLSSTAWGNIGDARYDANLYAVGYDLRLSGNFTYYANNDDVDGLNDQITQFDDRMTYGGRFQVILPLNEQHELMVGTSLRYDDIKDVGIGSSDEAKIYELIAKASAEELAWSAYSSISSNWNDWFTTEVGLRYDHFEFDVEDKLDNINSGHVNDDLVSPKLSLRFGPFYETEYFINLGKGFHSNDARGTTKAVDPVDPLAESEGAEVGFRSAIIPKVQVSMAVFALDLSSELAFVGDDGTVEPKDATRRTGVEVGVYYTPNDWLVLDLDYAASNTWFKDQQLDEDGNPIGQNVPDSIEQVASLGLSLDMDNGWYGGLRIRYFGPRALTEDGTVESDSTNIVNANLGYQFQNGIGLGLELLNVFDSEDHDITYYYESRTAEERAAGAGPITDFHSHPVEPREVRLSLSAEF